MGQPWENRVESRDQVQCLPFSFCIAQDRTVTQVVNTEILIDITPQENRVAVIENGLLQEIHLERSDLKGLVGNIYKGKVVRVLPGMQAAFVDVGLERAGFLHVSDIMPLSEEDQDVDLASPEADIRKWLHEGQEIIVQVVKDPLGTKGARLTTHLSIASRYLVYMPDLGHIGVSLRLEDEIERDRLQAMMSDILAEAGAKGYIVRTVAEGVEHAVLKRETEFLDKLWQQIQHRQTALVAPAIVHEDLPLLKRTIRDLLTSQVEAVRIDSETAYQSMCQFTEDFMPQEASKLKLYVGDMPIFEAYGVEEELKRALDGKVSLKSGGYLVIDQTEAMTTIDVNTGAFVGSINLEETIFKTNLEAVQAIARQLRLRNLGGIIVLDFIDMTEQSHKDKLMAALNNALQNDPARTHVMPLSDLGLIEMTRKRIHESLVKQMCEPCPSCEGRGYVKSITTISYEILRELLREARAYAAAGGLVVFASERVVHALLDEHAQALAELETFIDRPIKLKIEASFGQETYEIALI